MSAPRCAERIVRILGTRGVPNRHGGFESFAEELAPFLVARGWRVVVYCQEDGSGPTWESQWRGVRRVHIPVRAPGSRGTVLFDWKSTLHARNEPGLALVLGYNTAIFSAAYRLRRIPSVLNMDGMEWRRAKYTFAERGWFLLNERLGCHLADHLVADHPEIARYLYRRVPTHRVSTIAYGARVVADADVRRLEPYGLTPDRYLLLIARPEPENLTLEVVRSYSERPRALPLVVLGAYRRDHRYQRRVLDAAGPDVLFPGAVYEREAVDALRHFARVYVHGHTVGGTNPALVEALGAGAAVLAHDNVYNRWVAGDAARYFRDEAECAAQLSLCSGDEPPADIAVRRAAAIRRHATEFDLDTQLGRYEQLLERYIGGGAPADLVRYEAPSLPPSPLPFPATAALGTSSSAVTTSP